MSLPAEIRLMILTAVADRKHPGWASLASVCREWQHILEKVNFYKVRVRVTCPADFKYIISPQRRGLVHHVCLNIELPRYASTCCSKRPSPSVRLSPIVTDGIWTLFSILSTWGPADHLALEINMYSPSDCGHWFKHSFLSSDDVEPGAEAGSDFWSTEHAYHDPQYGWVDGQHVKASPRTAILRLFRPIRLIFKKTLPRVPAVTNFIIVDSSGVPFLL